MLNCVEKHGNPVPSPGEDGEEGQDTQVAISIMDLCEWTSIKKEDVIQTLQVRLIFMSNLCVLLNLKIMLNNFQKIKNRK